MRFQSLFDGRNYQTEKIHLIFLFSCLLLVPACCFPILKMLAPSFCITSMELEKKIALLQRWEVKKLKVDYFSRWASGLLATTPASSSFLHMYLSTTTGLDFKYLRQKLILPQNLLLRICCWGHILQKSEPGVQYLWFVPAGNLIWAWNDALLIMLPASWGHSHTSKDVAGNPINPGRFSPLPYSGHQNSVCCSSCFFCQWCRAKGQLCMCVCFTGGSGRRGGRFSAQGMG